MAGVCLALSACARHEDGDVDARLLADWSGPAMLAGQVQAPCDSVTIGTPVTRCRPERAIPAQSLEAYASAAAEAGQREAMSVREQQRLARLDVVVSATNARALSRVLETLTDAVRATDVPVDLLIDHSAVALQRFAVLHEARDLMLGLESATRALERAPTRHEAAWNRALALTWAGTRIVAARAWKVHDSLPDNAPSPVLLDDVAVGTPDVVALAGRWREASREHAWNVALPRYGRALLGGSPDSIRVAGALLDSLVTLSARDGLDGDVRALRDALRDAWTTKDTARLRQLHHAIDRYLWAHSGAGRQSMTAASAVIDSLRKEPSLPPALQRWVMMEHVNQLLVVGQSAAAIAGFERLAREAPSDSRIYRIRARSGGAMTYTSLGRSAEAVQQMRAVEAECADAQLESCQLSMAALGAMTGDLLGDAQVTAGAASRTMQALARAPLSMWHWSAAYLLRQVATSYGLPRAASAFDVEALVVAERLQRADLAATISEDQVRAAIESGDTSAARRYLREYRERWMPQLTADDQEWSRVNLLQFGAALVHHRDPAASRAMLDTALQLIANDDNDSRRTPLRMARAASLLAEGDTAEAMVEMDALMQQLRDRGRGRASVFDAARLDRLLSNLAVSSARVFRARGDAAGALRALSGVSTTGAVRRGAAPVPREAALALRLLSDSVWVWTATQTGLRLAVVPLAERVVRAAAGLDTTALQQVYRAVLAPVVESQQVESVCLDVRGLAAQLPWAAMRHRRGAYLVEAVRLVRTDDVSRGCPAAAGLSSASPVVVVDAAPTSGPRALLQSKREVQSLRQLWGASATVHDAVAGSGPTLRAMTSASLVHFAGHAVLDRVQPDRSYLLLTAPADSMITGATIAARRFSRTPLVILGACDAGAGSAGVFGGFDSIAGAFLSAGASAVIGAAWPVDDGPTGQLMVAVHRAVRAGSTPAEALRQAQMMALQSGDPALRTPRVWAAFQLMTHVP